MCLCLGLFDRMLKYACEVHLGQGVTGSSKSEKRKVEVLTKDRGWESEWVRPYGRERSPPYIQVILWQATVTESVAQADLNSPNPHLLFLITSTAACAQ